MSLIVITDSGADIAADTHAALRVVPLSIRLDGISYADGVDLTHDQFYNLLKESNDFPQTSQVVPYAFSEVLDEVCAQGHEVLIITLSSKLSGTYESALIATEGRVGVAVVDSLSATIGQRVLVEEALHYCDAGKTLAEVQAHLEEIKHRIRVVALLDTLEYLKRGGRIPATAQMIGELLSIKPVLGVLNGKAELLGKARGLKHAQNVLFKQVAQDGIDFSLPFAVGCTQGGEVLVEAYINDAESLWSGHIAREEIPVYSVGATIGSHVGPGALAVAFFAEDSEK